MDLNVFFTGAVVLALVSALWGIMWTQINKRVDINVCKIVHAQLDKSLAEIRQNQKQQHQMMLKIMDKLGVDPPDVTDGE